MIPKTIHYCWFGGKPLPMSVKKCIKSWKKKCPEYKIIQWNEGNFDVKSHPFLKAAYERKAWAFVSDYARLKIIYEHGGIYLDTDVELLRNLDLLLNYDSFFAIQQFSHLCNTGLGFGGKKGSFIVKEMLKLYDYIEFDISKKRQISCPILNDVAIKNLGYVYNEHEPVLINSVMVYPPKYFDPYAPGTTKSLLCKDTISIHHYSASWMGKKAVFRRKVLILLGPKYLYIIKSVFQKIKNFVCY